MDKKPVIVYADDHPYMRELLTANLKKRFPAADIVACNDIRTCRAAIELHRGNIAFLLLDECLSSDKNGSDLALEIREGKLGKDVCKIPIAICSSGEHVFLRADPPVFYFYKDNTDALFAHIEKYGFGGQEWQTLPQEAEAQKSRDHNAQMLINLLAPQGLDIFPEDESFQYDVNIAMQTMPSPAGKRFAEDGLAMSRRYFDAAFEGGGAPAIRLLEDIICAVDGDKRYIPEDGVAMRYGVLLSDIRNKALSALREIDPHGAEILRQRMPRV